MHPLGSFRIGTDHPSLPGHFPGEPVLPGVLLLDRALACLAAFSPGLRISGIERAKLLAPVTAGQEVAVHLEGAPGRPVLVCSVAGRPVARQGLRVAS